MEKVNCKTKVQAQIERTIQVMAEEDIRTVRLRHSAPLVVERLVIGCYATVYHGVGRRDAASRAVEYPVEYRSIGRLAFGRREAEEEK